MIPPLLFVFLAVLSFLNDSRADETSHTKPTSLKIKTSPETTPGSSPKSAPLGTKAKPSFMSPKSAPVRSTEYLPADARESSDLASTRTESISIQAFKAHSNRFASNKSLAAGHRDAQDQLEASSEMHGTMRDVLKSTTPDSPKEGTKLAEQIRFHDRTQKSQAQDAYVHSVVATVLENSKDISDSRIAADATAEAQSVKPSKLIKKLLQKNLAAQEDAVDKHETAIESVSSKNADLTSAHQKLSNFHRGQADDRDMSLGNY